MHPVTGSTHPPRLQASRQTCAAAHSKGYPLFPSTPASAHAARWWPNLSSGRPHHQVGRVMGRGKWSLRHNKRRNGCASIRLARDVGIAVSGAEARGPCWESLRGISQTRPHLLAHELLLQLPNGLLLPPKLRLVGLRLCLPHGQLRQFPQEGMLTLAPSKDCWHSRTDWKHGAVPPPKCVIIICGRVPFLDHADAIRPTCPVCASPGTLCARQPQNSCREGQRGDHPCQGWCCR